MNAKISVYVLLVFSVTTCFAQDSEFDELRNTFDRFVYENSNNDIGVGQKISSARAIENSLRQNKNKFSEREYYELASDLANFYFSAGAIDQSLSSFESIANSATEDLVKAEALVMLGWMQYASKMNLDKAEEYFSPAVELLKSIPETANLKRNIRRKELFGRTISTLAAIYRHNNQPEKAAAQYHQFLGNKEYVDFADSATLINAASNAARLYANKLDNPLIANEYYDLLVDLIAEAENVSLAVRIGMLSEAANFSVQHGYAAMADKVPVLEELLESEFASSKKQLSIHELRARARLANMINIHRFKMLSETEASDKSSKKFVTASSNLFEQIATALNKNKMPSQAKNELTFIAMQTGILRLDYFLKHEKDQEKFEQEKRKILKTMNPSRTTANFHPIVPTIYSPKFVEKVQRKFKEYLKEYSEPTPMKRGFNSDSTEALSK